MPLWESLWGQVSLPPVQEGSDEECLSIRESRLGSGYLPSPGEGFCHLAVPPAIAGGDEVSHPAALQEGGRGHLAFTEDLGKSDHFHESQTDDGCLGVVPTAEAIAEAGSHSNYVLQRPQRRG